jgi:hypothetical protein
VKKDLLCLPKERGQEKMKPAGAASLDQEQSKFRNQLHKAVENINQADDLLNVGSVEAINRATALLLSAIGRVLVLETAEKHGLGTRLPVFKHQPK